MEFHNLELFTEEGILSTAASWTLSIGGCWVFGDDGISASWYDISADNTPMQLVCPFVKEVWEQIGFLAPVSQT